MALRPFAPGSIDFDDSNVARVTTASVSVYSESNDKSRITGTWYRDELVHIYDEVVAEEPVYNPVWYRVWGGYLHRARLQRVKFLYNTPVSNYPSGVRSLVEVTVPFTQPWRFTKAFGWEPLNPLLYYESVHWIEGVDEGPDGDPWYLIYDDLTGTYHVNARHLRPIPAGDLTPIRPEIPRESKRLQVNLTTQSLTAYEYEKPVYQTKIASGIPAGRTSKNEISTKTPSGDFFIQEKMPAKHMGNGNLFAGTDDYELPGVSWTCFFTELGHAFHGTYWHDNFGTPMSHGCVNMRTEDARWLFRWVDPVFDFSQGKIYQRGLGTPVTILYS